MKDNLTSKRIKLFLLGELPDDEQAQLEERMFVEQDFFDELLAAEDELVDAYLRGELSAHERERFATHFLSTPQRRQKLSFARTFRKYVAASAPLKPPQTAPASRLLSWRQGWSGLLRAGSPAWNVAYVAAAVMFVAVLLFLVRWGQTTRQEPLSAQRVETSPISQNSQTKITLPDEDGKDGKPPSGQQKNDAQSGDKSGTRPPTTELIKKPRETGVSPVIATLLPGAIRDEGEMQKFRLPAKAKTVSLKLVLGEQPEGVYRSYRVQLLRGERVEPIADDISPNDPAWIRSGPNKSRKALVVRLRASFLTTGEYQLKLSAQAADGTFEDLDSYPFRVSPARAVERGRSRTRQ